jgi:hypothetical protein
MTNKYSMEEAIKKAAAEQTGTTGQCAAPIGSYGLSRDLEDPVRPGLLERVEMDLRRATRESRKAQDLAELHALLLKNPDVARILSLWDLVRG